MIKKTIYLFALLIITCKMSSAQGSYGEKVEEQNAITMDELVKNMTGKEEMQATITGKIAAVCRLKAAG